LASKNTGDWSGLELESKEPGEGERLPRRKSGSVLLELAGYFVVIY
jgi:hypothetical protein